MKKRFLTLIIAALTLSLLVCASVVAASASEETPTVSIDRFNLTFESDTYIKYAVKFGGIDDESITRGNTGMLYWTEPQTSYTIGSESSSSEIIGYTTIEGEKYYTFSYDKFAAKQMTDYIYSVAYVIVDGEYYYSAPVKYSILTYAYDKLGYTGTATESEALINMLDGLLNYGAWAQVYFDYRTDHLADEQYYQVTVEGGTLEDGFTTGLYLEGEAVAVAAQATNKNAVPFAAWLDEYGTELSADYATSLEVATENSIYTATYADYGLVYTLQSDDTYSVTGYTATAKNIIIPCIYEGKLVTGIGEGALSYCDSFTSIRIPDTVTSIGASSFKVCTNLMDIEIPGSVTYIGDDAFWRCDSLTSVAIGEGVNTIGDGTFCDCDSLTNVIVADSVTRIGNDAFNDCNNLECIAFTDESKLEIIGDGAFAFCGSLVCIEIPDGVTRIGSFAFSECEGITSIELPDSVTSIGERAFEYCGYLGIIEMPTTLTSIGACAFIGCTSLTDIEIPSGTVSIGDSCFEGCTGLTTIDFNAVAMNDLDYDGVFDLAGREETGITVNIGADVTKIPANLFCPSYEETYPNITEVIFAEDAKCQIMGDWAFYGCVGITSIEIPDGIISLGDSCFEGCTGLSYVAIPDSVTSIGTSAFAGCTGLDCIEIPAGVVVIGQWAFSDCTGLTTIDFNAVAMDDLGSEGVFDCAGNEKTGITVNIGADVTKIPANLFCPSYEEAYPNITEVIFAEGAKCRTIGNWAFYGCASLTGIEIPDGIISLGDSCFEGCVGLSYVAVPDSVTSIGTSAFAGCTGLESIEIPAGVVVIGQWAFSDCTGLTTIDFNAVAMNDLGDDGVFECAGSEGPGITVNIGADVTRIPAYLFCPYYVEDYPNITEVIFAEGSKCKAIGDFAFWNCDLGSIVIPDGVTSIGYNAFEGNMNLTSVVIPDSVTVIRGYAFYNCGSLTIYCEAESQPDNWASDWNPDDRPVVWGYKG